MTRLTVERLLFSCKLVVFENKVASRSCLYLALFPPRRSVLGWGKGVVFRCCFLCFLFSSRLGLTVEVGQRRRLFSSRLGFVVNAKQRRSLDDLSRERFV